MTSPTPMASGRDADVFALDADRVLRRYRNGADATTEAAVMKHVSTLGYPVPRVYSVDHAEMVLERLNGPTMGHAILTGNLSPQAGGRQLADLQTRLHALPPRSPANPRLRILHCDLHPDNVMLTQHGPVVIDWSNATEGPPSLDVALSAVILAQIAVNGIDDIDDMAEPARALLQTFLAHSRRIPRTALAEALAIRHTNPNLSETETGHLDEAGALIETLSTET